MSVRNVTLDGQHFVLVPRHQWKTMIQSARSTPSVQTSGETFGIDDVRKSLASRMAGRRRAAGLTQSQLARMARVRVETISRLENGLHMPGVRTFDKIDRALARASKRRAA